MPERIAFFEARGEVKPKGKAAKRAGSEPPPGQGSERRVHDTPSTRAALRHQSQVDKQVLEDAALQAKEAFHAVAEALRPIHAEQAARHITLRKVGDELKEGNPSPRDKSLGPSTIESRRMRNFGKTVSPHRPRGVVVNHACLPSSGCSKT